MVNESIKTMYEAMKNCRACAQPMRRKMRGTRIETASEYAHRVFCSLPCKSQGQNWAQVEHEKLEALRAVKAQIAPYDEHVRKCGNRGRRWLWGQRVAR